MAGTERDEPRVDEPSLGGLFSRMTGDVGELVKKEIELAKTEVKEELSHAGKAGGKLGAAALTGYLGLLFASFALALLLDEVMHVALAFAIVAVIYAIATYLLQQQGRKQMKVVKPLPQTADSIKEDVEWAKTRNS